MSLNVGDLIKIPTTATSKRFRTASIIMRQRRRYVFPNEKYFLRGIQIFKKCECPGQMSLIPIGGNVTIARITTCEIPNRFKTYIITKGGVLRWAKTEEVAWDGLARTGINT